MERTNDVFLLIGRLESSVESIKEARKICGRNCQDNIKNIKGSIVKVKKVSYIALSLGSISLIFHFIKAEENDLIYTFLKKLLSIF
jgi:hypothetical protein